MVWIDGIDEQYGLTVWTDGMVGMNGRYGLTEWMEGIDGKYVRTVQKDRMDEQNGLTVWTGGINRRYVPMI